MRRSDPNTVTYLLAFLVVYLLVTGALILVLRGLILGERADELERLEERADVLDETMRLRAEQEREIILELMSIAGSRDFESAYAMIRSDIENLSARFEEIEELATLERERRIEVVRERDDAVSRARALRLETDRLEANVEACLLELSTCDEC